jgi:hypothetical protein
VKFIIFILNILIVSSILATSVEIHCNLKFENECHHCHESENDIHDNETTKQHEHDSKCLAKCPCHKINTKPNFKITQASNDAAKQTRYSHQIGKPKSVSYILLRPPISSVN